MWTRPSKPTLIRKIKSGEIKAYRVGKECRIPESEIKRPLEGKTPDKVAIYARVSSRDQREDLERQVEYLKDYCSSEGYQVLKILTDFSSGLNGSRRGLKQLFKLVEGGEVGNVQIITTKGELGRAIS